MATRLVVMHHAPVRYPVPAPRFARLGEALAAMHPHHAQAPEPGSYWARELRLMGVLSSHALSDKLPEGVVQFFDDERVREQDVCFAALAQRKAMTTAELVAATGFDRLKVMAAMRGLLSRKRVERRGWMQGEGQIWQAMLGEVTASAEPPALAVEAPVVLPKLRRKKGEVGEPVRRNFPRAIVQYKLTERGRQQMMLDWCIRFKVRAVFERLGALTPRAVVAALPKVNERTVLRTITQMQTDGQLVRHDC